MIAPHLHPHAHAHPRPWAPHAFLRSTAVGGALLLLGTSVLVSRAPQPRVQNVSVGSWPGALVLAGAHAFVANDGDGTLSIVDLTQARRLHTLPLDRNSVLAPHALALVPQTHRLFVVARRDDRNRSVVTVLDSRSGVVLRTVRVGALASAVAVDERAGQVLVTDEGDGTLSTLDARTGALLHTSRVGPNPVALAVDARRAHAFIVEARPLTPGIPEQGASRGVVRLLDTRSGALLRTVAVGHGPGVLAIVPNTNRAFVTNRDDGTVSVLDARSGRVLRTVRVGTTPCALAVDGRLGRVFVLDAGDGTLSMLDARTGQLQQTLSLERHPRSDLAAALPCALAVDAPRARVYASTAGPLDRAGLPLGPGRLHVIDARRGVRLQTIAVGLNPQALAVETSTGRIVVADGGGVLGPDMSGMGRLEHWVGGWLPRLARLIPGPTAPSRVLGSLSLVSPPS